MLVEVGSVEQRDYKRWERSRAMELWQTDIVGRFHLADGTELSVVTGIDDHRRFCVCARLVVRATARPVTDDQEDGPVALSEPARLVRPIRTVREAPRPPGRGS